MTETSKTPESTRQQLAEDKEPGDTMHPAAHRNAALEPSREVDSPEEDVLTLDPDDFEPQPATEDRPS